jgi:hypothetical protein
MKKRERESGGGEDTMKMTMTIKKMTMTKGLRFRLQPAISLVHELAVLFFSFYCSLL